MPLENATALPDHDWLCHGMLSLLQQSLGGDERLEVLSTASAQALWEPGADRSVLDRARTQAQLLGLDAVVHATLRRQAEDLWLDWRLFIVTAGRLRESCGSLREWGTANFGHRLADALSVSLFPGAAPDLRPVFGDPFLQQAWARGHEMLSQEDYATALPLFELVAQMAPEHLAGELGAVRCLVTLSRPEGVERARALLSKAREAGDRRLQARAHVALFVAHMRGRPAQAAAEDAAVMAMAHEPAGAAWWREDWLLRHLINRGTQAQFGSRWNDAETLYAQAEQACRDCGHQPLLAAALRNAVFVSLARGDIAGARARVDGALRLYAQVPQAVAVLHLTATMAVVDAAAGRLAAAADRFDDFTRRLERTQRPMLPLGTLGAVALTHAERGRSAPIRGLLDLMQARPAGLEHFPLGSRLVAQACLRMLEGGFEEARRNLRAALELGQDQPGAYFVRGWTALLLRLHAAAGDEVEAELLRSRIPSAPGFGEEVDLPCALARSRAMSLLSDGRGAEAARELAAAVAQVMPAQLDAPAPAGREHACALLDLAWLMLEGGDLEQGSACLARCGPWAREHPAGLAAQARAAWLRGDARRASSWQGQALASWQGSTPAAHAEFAAIYADGPPGRSVPALARLLTESWWPEPD